MKRKISGKNIGYLLLLAAVLVFMIYQRNQEDSPKYAHPEETQTAVAGSSGAKDIRTLTDRSAVVKYLRKHKKLPDYYLTKKEAKRKGWIPHKGNLCKVLPGKAIGGDYFGNFERHLPSQKGRKYYEADIDYNCGRRGAKRLIYSNDGLIYVTEDHYKTFQRL